MNIMLMEAYDEYNNQKTIHKLEEFTKLTFPQDGTDKLFIGCVLILFESVYKSRLSAETLYTVVSAAKEPIGKTNLLKFYMDRVNGNRLVSKYLSKVINDNNLEKYTNLILEYITERSFDFSKSIKRNYREKIEDYII